MSSHLVLFRQVKEGERFTFETPSNFRQHKKISDTQAITRLYPLEWGTEPITINPDVLVFTEGTQTDEVSAIGNALELL